MKTYVKPEIYFESFELSQNVAACGLDMSNATDEYSCEAQIDTSIHTNYPPGVVVFASSNTDCMTEWESYCYQTSVEQNRVFNS